jgi:penicillin-binding protein 1A
MSQTRVGTKFFSQRKIVLLRRSMGVYYGENSLILPSWRLEGADNPFGLRLFPGYFAYSSFPIFLLSSFSALSLVLLFDNIPLGEFSTKEFELIHPSRTAVIFGGIWFLSGFWIFRYSLNEQNENLYLWFARLISLITRIPLVPNVEYNLYRCKLEIAEAARLGAQTDLIRKFALFIEDKEFYRHKGINWRGVIRAFWQLISRRRRSGGSSITQQCARTNFLDKLSPPWRRKLVEFALARWLESVMSKEEIIRIYLTTARFDFEIYGFHRAFHHYFPKEKTIDNAVSFVLIERLGNIRSLFLGGRVEQLLQRLLDDGLIDRDDVKRVGALYQELIDTQKIKNIRESSPNEIVTRICQNG